MTAANSCMSCAGGFGGCILAGSLIKESSSNEMAIGFIAGSIIGSIPLILLSDRFIKSPRILSTRDTLYINGYMDAYNKSRKKLKIAAAWGMLGGCIVLLFCTLLLSGMP
jgi:hypothetical protein